MSLKKVITESGFACDVDDDALDDMELLDFMGALYGGDDMEVMKLSKVIERMIGTEQKKALYEHCRDGSGRVRIHAVTEELMGIMSGLKEDKKKS